MRSFTVRKQPVLYIRELIYSGYWRMWKTLRNEDSLFLFHLSKIKSHQKNDFGFKKSMWWRMINLLLNQRSCWTSITHRFLRSFVPVTSINICRGCNLGQIQIYMKSDLKRIIFCSSASIRPWSPCKLWKSITWTSAEYSNRHEGTGRTYAEYQQISQRHNGHRKGGGSEGFGRSLFCG